MTPVLDHGSRGAEGEVRPAGRGGRVPGVVLPLGGRRRQRRRRACAPAPCATATTTCSPAASSGSRTRASATSTPCSPRPIPTPAIAASAASSSRRRSRASRSSKLEHKLGVRGSPTGEIVARRLRRARPRTSSARRAAASQYAMGALDRSRPLVGAQALGIAQRRARPRDAATCRTASSSARGIADFQGLQFMLADMATQVDAARLLVYRACSLLDAGLHRHRRARRRWRSCSPPTPRCGSRPTACSSSAAIGYTKDMPAERFMRDAKITQIYEGTNQIQRIVIAKRLLSALTVTIRYARRGRCAHRVRHDW